MSNPHPKPSPGRPKGVPNKLTQELKDALLAPFDAKKFKKWADKRPEQYFTLIITKLLPKDVIFTGTLESILRGLSEEELAERIREIAAKSAALSTTE